MLLLNLKSVYNNIILINRSNIELVYDATGSETPTPRALPPTTEYELFNNNYAQTFSHANIHYFVTIRNVY